MQRMRMSFAALAAIWLGGCVFGPVDQFADRSVGYNLEAEQSQDRAVLLNVVRASMRRPPQFTGLQTVTGTASLSGGGQVNFPFSHGPRFTSDTGQVNASVTGGPTFAVAVLDTQEFYRGIMAPIDLQTIDFFVQRRYSRTALFNLVISRIVVRQAGKVLELGNVVGDPGRLQAFQAAIDYLLNLGLTTETVKDVTAYSPYFAPDRFAGAEQAAKAAGAKLEMGQVGWCDLQDGDELDSAVARYAGNVAKRDIVQWCKAKAEAEDEKKEEAAAKVKALGVAAALAEAAPVKVACPPHGPRASGTFGDCFPHLPPLLYRLQKTDMTAQFCFERRGPTSRDNRLYSTDKFGCDADKPDKGSGKKRPKGGAPQASLKDLTLGKGFGTALQGAGLKDLHGIDFAAPLTSIDFVPRTAEGVVYYLGEIVRRQLYPDRPAKPAFVSVKYGPEQTEDIPLAPCGAEPGLQLGDFVCEPLFRVLPDRPGGSFDSSAAFVTVAYDGQSFGISRDNDRGSRDVLVGRTYQVLDLATKLIDLNRSAKDEPRTSVFTIVNP